jgi:hypothetical protein
LRRIFDPLAALAGLAVSAFALGVLEVRGREESLGAEAGS